MEAENQVLIPSHNKWGSFCVLSSAHSSKQREHEDQWGGTEAISSVGGFVAYKDRCLCTALIQAYMLLNILLLEWGEKMQWLISLDERYFVQSGLVLKNVCAC